MADRATESISINADRRAVMAVIADFAAYPDWVDMIRQAEVLETGPDGRASQVRFVLDAGILKDDYVLAYEWSDDERVEWTLVRSKALKAQEGSYSLADVGGATLVTYDLAVDLRMPVLGALKRKAQQVIVDTALKGLKKRVESRG
jgi:hypothetical protein